MFRSSKSTPYAEKRRLFSSTDAASSGTEKRSSNSTAKALLWTCRKTHHLATLLKGPFIQSNRRSSKKAKSEPPSSEGTALAISLTRKGKKLRLKIDKACYHSYTDCLRCYITAMVHLTSIKEHKTKSLDLYTILFMSASEAFHSLNENAETLTLKTLLTLAQCFPTYSTIHRLITKDRKQASLIEFCVSKEKGSSAALSSLSQHPGWKRLKPENLLHTKLRLLQNK